ncbi:MAG TPA: formylglycine-generating enzyme family protein [Blastocatellia bacterium]|nr:formylglycine-generating enzyme family protein [Blastocatellia bacterium]
MRETRHSVEEKRTSQRRLLFWLAALMIGAATIAIFFSRVWSAKPHAGAGSHHRSGDASSSASRPDAQSALAVINRAPAPGPAPVGMVWVPGGTFWMGCDGCEMPDAQPVHLVSIDGFWMDRTPVTNAQFEEFVRATRYVTAAERKPDPKDYPGVDPIKLVAGSAVFSPPARDVTLDDVTQWWRYVPGASWKHPEGPASSIEGRDDHPVVQIAWEDAAAYAKWAGKRLPREAEFEFAARGGLDRNLYAWGNELKPGGKWVANIWQGRFPSQNTRDDGYLGTSPVTAFPPNGFGLYDVGGNVWQWCADWYRTDYYANLSSNGLARNPQGPPDSYDPKEPGVAKRVQKGGSFLCSDRYCSRYLAGSRGRGAVDSGGSNTGFRCVKSP